jgi:Protein of Unknown function (DUF2784)
MFRLLADLVAVLHGLFLLYIVFGGFAAWRWPKSIWLHVAAVVWGVGIVAIGWECPLTDLEEWFARRGGEDITEAGFVDRYVEDVIYPERFTPWVRAAAACSILISWYGVIIRRFTSRGGRVPASPRSNPRPPLRPPV